MSFTPEELARKEAFYNYTMQDPGVPTPSRLRGIGHMRGHETDRLAALAAELGSLGAKVVEHEDGLEIAPAKMHGGVFHTYSAYARGIDALSVDYQYLDLVPKGRDEDDRGPYWVRRHDEYDR